MGAAEQNDAAEERSVDESFRSHTWYGLRQRIVEILVGQWRTAKPEEGARREAALAAIGAFRAACDDAVVRYLLEDHNSQDQKIKASAIKNCGVLTVRHPKVVKALCEDLKTPGTSVFSEAKMALYNILSSLNPGEIKLVDGHFPFYQDVFVRVLLKDIKQGNTTVRKKAGMYGPIPATRHPRPASRHTPLATRHTPHATRHTSSTTRHKSSTTRHTSSTTRHTSSTTRGDVRSARAYLRGRERHR